MWAARAVKFGYRWVIRNGRSIRFWEDCWFGSAPLVVQYWVLYCICREQCITLDQVWDVNELKLSFWRCFNNHLMELWFELVEIAKSVSFSDENDSLIWQYNSSGVILPVLCMLSSILGVWLQFSSLLCGNWLSP